MVRSLLYGCKNKFLVEAIAGGIDRHRAILPGVRDQRDIFPCQLLPDIVFRVVRLHLCEKDIPHLIVGAEILDFLHQLIFCHKFTPFSLMITDKFEGFINPFTFFLFRDTMIKTLLELIP